MLHRHYCVPVHTIVLLLRPQACHPNLDGTVGYALRPGRGKMDFSYEVIPLWERPVETLLAGGLATLPLAVLGKLPAELSLEDGLASVIGQLVERLQREAPPEQTKRLLTAAFVLTGMRVEGSIVRQLFQGVRAMRESDTYLAILEEGAVEQTQKILLRQGRKRFGEPGATTQAALQAISDLSRLERLIDRVLDAASWQELLQTP